MIIQRTFRKGRVRMSRFVPFPRAFMESDSVAQRITVPYAYDVAFTRGLFRAGDGPLGAFLERLGPGPHRALVYVDDGLASAHPGLEGMITDWSASHRDLLDLATGPIRVPGGEKAKEGFGLVESVLGDIDRHGLCRQSLVLIAGGGAVLDAVGVAATLAHRGLRQVRLPSTVLAQADSGVGVKNGINLRGKKNFAGAFAPPAAVLCDLDLLDTLADRDWIAGTSEAFKVAIIKDARFLDDLRRNTPAVRQRDRDAMAWLVRRCAELHLDHIARSGDPFETGNARPLDFGHWAAHRAESLTGYEMRHGEAVAMGMALDCEIAGDLGLLDRDEVDLVIRSLAAMGLPVWHPVLEDRDPDGRRAILAGIREFREHLGGELCVTLPDGLGRKVEVNELDETLVEAAAVRLRLRAERRAGAA
jgi:3-dehydroquinate synthase